MTTTAQPVPKNASRTEYMQPFADSLKNFFEVHQGSSLTFGKLTVNADNRPPFEIAGVITLSNTVVGRVVISLPLDVATAVCAAYLKMDPPPDGVVRDSVGEIANVIVGRAKSSRTQHHIMISPPTVVKGSDFSICPQRDAACLPIPCESSFGSLQLDINMVCPGSS